MSADFNIVPTS